MASAPDVVRRCLAGEVAEGSPLSHWECLSLGVLVVFIIRRISFGKGREDANSQSLLGCEEPKL